MKAKTLRAILSLHEDPKARQLIESISKKVDEGTFDFTGEEEEFSLAFWEALEALEPTTEEEWKRICEEVRTYVKPAAPVSERRKKPKTSRARKR